MEGKGREIGRSVVRLKAWRLGNAYTCAMGSQWHVLVTKRWNAEHGGRILVICRCKRHPSVNAKY